MYDRIKKLYHKDRLTKAGVYNAVKKKLITQEQAEEIIASKEA